ncbi:MAG: glycine--tRNA ligase subunit beta [Panacagrimonas sp.]
MNHDLLLELGCEDLPARYVLPLAEALNRGLRDGLSRRGVVTGVSQVFATPRRIAALIADVADQQPDQAIERLGPALGAAVKDGKPTPAGLGFARSCGVAFESLGQKDGKLHFSKTAPGRATRELIPEIFEDTLKQMDELVPKRMRWGAGEETFVRPVEWLCCLFGGDVVPLRRFGRVAGRLTYGHRFHAPEAIPLSEPRAYADQLLKARVWAVVADRKDEIRKQIESQAARLGGHARITGDLLDEVTALVELPKAIAGQFEARFLELPPEVIVATVETNQRYFTVFEDEALTRLTRHFITVSNIESRDVAQVISGNERVVRPRLTDALFFWQQDLKLPLADYAARLDAVTFQKDLGSTGDKVRRIVQLAGHIAARLDVDGAIAARAAQLCKADLVTKVVYEFPEVQGLMGGYYALKSGEPAEVAAAIREHYLPTQQGTPIPSTPAGQVVALADKLDTLAGIFAIGQKPTASKDPYALRRAALGVLRICIEGELPLDLRDLLARAVALQPLPQPASKPAAQRDDKLVAELADFVMERFSGLCASRLFALAKEADAASPHQGIVIADFPVAEIVQAVSASASLVPLDLMRRAEALLTFLKLPEATALAAANKRVRNILRQAGSTTVVAIDPTRFEHPAEGALFKALDTLAALNAETSDYTAKLRNLAALRGPVDAFFDGVMVNAENATVRANRLALLGRLDAMCREVADLSCLPG